MTVFEKLVAKSILKQAELLTQSNILHYDNVTNLYNRIIDLQILFLSNSIDNVKALELLKEAKKITKSI